MSSELNVLHVFVPPDGGVPEHVRVLAIGLHAAGVGVKVAGPPDAVVRPAIEAAGIGYCSLALDGRPGRVREDIAAVRTLVGLLRFGRFDLVHAHSQKAGIVARLAARAAAAPAVYTPHFFQYRTQLHRHRRGMRGRYFAGWTVERLLSHWTAATIAVSDEELRTALHDRVARPGRIRRIHPGVAPDPSLPADEELAAFRGDGPLFGFVGGLREQKGLPLLLDALELLSDRGGVPRFAIVGNGLLEGPIRARVARAGLSDHVRVFPFSGRVEPYLQALDVFVLPSYWEGLPIGLLEAMALGVAVIATAVGGIPEAVVDGETGWLVQPEDAVSLAGAVAQASIDVDMRRHRGAVGRARAQRHFTARDMTAATREIYAQLIDARSGGRRARTP